MTNLEKWINALESGEYKQTKGCLADNYGYCCMGVLCEVYKKDTGNGEWTEPKIDNIVASTFVVPDTHDTSTRIEEKVYTPPNAVWTWLNEPVFSPMVQEDEVAENDRYLRVNPDMFAMMNDSEHMSFKEIAEKLRDIPTLTQDYGVMMYQESLEKMYRGDSND